MSTITRLLFSNTVNSEQLTVIGDAYDVIVQTFPEKGHKAVALALLMAARTGERDLRELCLLTVEFLGTELDQRQIDVGLGNTAQSHLGFGSLMGNHEQ